MTTISVKTAAGEMIASGHYAGEAFLCFDREYEEGDCIEIVTDVKHLTVQMDSAVLPGEVYVPDGRMTWKVPFGEHRLAYSPAAFQGRHLITAREMSREETMTRRNIARNPADLRGETDFYPHAEANVETRGESCFAARNVIDGMRIGNYHGEWPYQSWGIGAREDAWCKISFGREVAIDSMALTLRSDFPHDAWWTNGHVVLSDGSEFAFPLEKTGDRQFIELGGHRVEWMRLEHMQKSDDPSAFPALIEWEVFGRDV